MHYNGIATSMQNTCIKYWRPNSTNSNDVNVWPKVTIDLMSIEKYHVGLQNGGKSKVYNRNQPMKISIVTQHRYICTVCGLYCLSDVWLAHWTW